MACLKLDLLEQDYKSCEQKMFAVKNTLTLIKTDLNLRSAYTYGFNGQEKDNEVAGSGNSYDFGARMYDARLGRWLSVDPLAPKYPNLSPYNFTGNNPILFVDYDGRDFGIDVDDETKTITIKATYYTAADNVGRLNAALQKWNGTSGKYYYRTGNRKEGYQYYKVNFELTAQANENPLMSSQDDNTGNSFDILSDNHPTFKKHPNRGAATYGHENIGIRESRKDQVLPSAHEVGHTLIGGEGHTSATIMNRSIEGGGAEPGIMDVIDANVISDVLGTAGIGRKRFIRSNRSNEIDVEKGDKFKALDTKGKVVSERAMKRQVKRQERRQARQEKKQEKES